MVHKMISRTHSNPTPNPSPNQVGRAVVYMASLPLEANVLHMTL